MNELIGKLKSEFKNILSQEDKIIEDIDLSLIEQITFTPSHKLDEDEWFKITAFSKQSFFINECSSNFGTASLTQIGNREYKHVRGIAILQDNQIHFQRITPALFVNRKTILDYSGTPKIVEHKKQIEIRKTSDAIYIKDKDTLFFKNISKIKLLFPGIENLHRKATQSEVDDFLKNDFVELSEYEPSKVGVLNRKRIADIGMKYNKLSKGKQKKLIDYAKDKSGIKYERGSFVIASESDLKNLLYAMDQRYYYADIYDENRLANSVRLV